MFEMTVVWCDIG